MTGSRERHGASFTISGESRYRSGSLDRTGSALTVKVSRWSADRDHDDCETPIPVIDECACSPWFLRSCSLAWLGLGCSLRGKDQRVTDKETRGTVRTTVTTVKGPAVAISTCISEEKGGAALVVGVHRIWQENAVPTGIEFHRNRNGRVFACESREHHVRGRGGSRAGANGQSLLHSLGRQQRPQECHVQICQCSAPTDKG